MKQMSSKQHYNTRAGQPIILLYHRLPLAGT